MGSTILKGNNSEVDNFLSPELSTKQVAHNLLEKILKETGSPERKSMLIDNPLKLSQGKP